MTLGEWERNARYMFIANDEIAETFDLFVTGNGFDKAFGFPTSYSDFYNELLSISNNLGDKNNYLNQSSSKIEIGKLGNFYNIAYPLLTSNYFIQYVLAYKKGFENWCDFESELEKILIGFDNIFSQLEENLNNASNMFEIKRLDNIPIHFFSPEFSHILKDFLLTTNDNFITGELYDMQYKGPYDRLSLTNRVTKIKENIINTLFNDLKQFKNIFKQYLLTFVDESKIKYISNFEVGNIVTYNYTNVTRKAFAATDNIFHIHGDIESDIVLGIDDSSEFKDKRFLRFQKSSQRSNVDNDVSLEDMITGSSYIGYFGLSFDKNDSGSLKAILNLPNAIHNFYYYSGDNGEAYEDLKTNLKLLLGNSEYTNRKNKNLLRFYPAKSLIK